MSNGLYDSAKYKGDLRAIASLSLPWEKLNGRKILVAGATGMIGKCFVDLMMQKVQEGLDCHITVFSRNEQSARNRFDEKYFSSPHFSYVCHDVCDPTEGVFDRGYDYVLNMASNTHPMAYSQKPVDTIWANVCGTRNLLELCADHPGSRYVLTSSVEVYGENRGDTELFDEKYLGYIDSNTVRAGYPESKRVCEALCQAYIKERSVDAVIARLPRVYGPTMSDGDSKAVAQFIKKAIAGENIVLKSDGSQYYSFAYVADAVAGILTVMLKGETGEAYNIADEKCDGTLKQAASICAREGGREVVFELPDETEKAGYSTATVARLDGKKIRGLGWRPLYDFEGGLTRTISVLRSR